MGTVLYGTYKEILDCTKVNCEIQEMSNIGVELFRFYGEYIGLYEYPYLKAYKKFPSANTALNIAGLISFMKMFFTVPDLDCCFSTQHKELNISLPINDELIIAMSPFM